MRCYPPACAVAVWQARPHHPDVGVMVGLPVGVSLGKGVGVAVAPGTAVSVGVGVLDGVNVGPGVGVSVGTAVAVGVGDGPAKYHGAIKLVLLIQLYQIAPLASCPGPARCSPSAA